MKTIKRLVIPMLMNLSVILAGCEEDIATEFAAPPSNAFDIALFKENVDDYLGGNSTGYCYVIAQDGQVVYSEEVGERISGADGSVDQDVHAAMYAASVSKAITAVAALKLMEDKGISINDKVWQYLPSHWTIHASFKQISFKNLLQHKSGIDEDAGYDYASLKALAAAGVSLGDIGVDSEYSNANFGLFRILIPYMIQDQDNLFNSSEISIDDWLVNVTAATYRLYVKMNLFEPLNIFNVDTKPVGAHPTLYYSFPTGNGQSGWSIGDRTLLAGGGGWYISCYDLAKLFAYVRFTEEIISEESRELMDDNFLGWDKGLSESASYEHGTYHAKNGGFKNGDDQGVSTLVKNFPEGVQISVMINSRGGNYGALDINDGMGKAFDDAWVPQQ
jgi:CubicO group peptidase (beta-lactamase class C family)